MMNVDLGDQLKLTVKLAVRLVRAEKNSRYDNGLQALLVIESSDKLNVVY